MPAPVTVGEALKKLDREAAKQALAARVNGREVDLAFTLDVQQNDEALEIEPVLPQTLEGLDVLRHSTAHLLAAAVLDLFPGTKLNVRTLGTPGGVGTDFEVSLLRHIAAGLGIGYEELASDFSRSNYSSARASMIGTHKHMLAKKKFVADRLADEIYSLWVEEWLAAGNLPLPRGETRDIFYKPFGKECLVSCDWIGMGRGQIDPLKETQAALLLVRANMSTREAEIAKFGGDWKRTFRQLAREKKLAEELGLVTPGTSPTESVKTLVGFTEDLLRRVGIPLRLDEVGFDSDDLDWVARETMPSGSTKANPRPVTEGDAREVTASCLR